MFFCFFLTSLTVMFLPSFQLISQPFVAMISGPSKSAGSFMSGSHFIVYDLVKTELVKKSFSAKWKLSVKPCNS